MNKKYTGIILATMVGSLFATTSIAEQKSGSHEGSVKCLGANACKGHSACQTANNGCKGQNSCKGQGYIMTSSKQECTKKGGTVDNS